MAAVLQVDIQGQQAVQTAKQVAQAITSMGTAAEQSLPKLAALQEAASKPIGAAATPTSVTGLLTSMERVRQVYASMQQQAAAAAGLGGNLAAGMREAAAGAARMQDALASTIQMAMELAREGQSTGEVYAALTEQIKMMDNAYAGLSAEGKNAWANVSEGAEQAVTGTKAYVNAQQTITEQYGKQVTAAQQRAAQEAAQREKEAAAAEKAAERERIAKEKEAQQEEAAAEKRAMAEERARKREEAAAEESSKQIKEKFTGLREMLMAPISFGAGMLGFQAGMEAIEAPIQALKEAMAAGAGEEKLVVGLGSVVGQGKAAQEQLEKLKDFITGPLGAAFKLDDVVEGVTKLERMTSTLDVSDEHMKMIAATAEVNKQSFSHVAEQYGRVTLNLQEGNPVRAQLLNQMVAEGLITEQTVAKIETMIKAHKDHDTIIKTLDAAMAAHEAEAQRLGNTYDNLTAQLRQTFDVDVLTPFGQAFVTVLEQIAPVITNLFKGHADDIKKMADTVQDDLMYAFLYVKNFGIEQALKDGWDQMLAYVKSSVIPALQSAFSTWWNEQVKVFQQDWENIKPTWAGGTGELGKEIRSSETSQGIDKLAQGALQPQNWTEPLVSIWNGIGKTLTDIYDVLNKPQAPSGATLAALQAAIGTTPAAATKADQEALRAVIQEQSQKTTDQTLAAKDQTVAGNAQRTATDQNKTALDQSKTAVDSLTAAINTLVGAMANLPNMFGGLPGGPLTPQAPFPGAVRAMSEWMPGETMTRANQYGPFNNKLQLGDVAMSVDLMAKMGVKMGDFIDILDKAGNVILAHQRVADTSFFHPGAETHGIELWGRPDIGWAGVRRSQTGLSLTAPTAPAATAQQKFDKDWQDYLARKKAEEGAPKAAPGTTAIEKPGKAGKDLSEEKKLTDELTSATKTYDDQIKHVEEDKKAHLITSEQAAQKELDIYRQEQQSLEGLKTKFEAAYQAALKAHDTKGAEAYKQKLDQIGLKLADIIEKEKLLAQSSTFLGQAQEELGKKIQDFSFNGTKAVDLLASSFEQVNSALLSLNDGTTKASDAFKKMALSIVNDVENTMLKAIEAQLMQALQNWASQMASSAGGGGGIGGIFSAILGMFAGHQSGGLISGPSGTDKVPAKLTAGEYVLTQSAVNKYGLQMIEAMNRGTYGFGVAQHFALGGMVPGTSAANTPPSQNPAAGSVGQSVAVTTNITIPPATTTGGAAQGGTAGAGGMSKEDVARFNQAITNAVRQEITVQKRPGGLLSKHQMS